LDLLVVGHVSQDGHVEWRNAIDNVSLAGTIEIDVDEIVRNRQENNLVESGESRFPIIRIPPDDHLFIVTPFGKPECTAGHNVARLGP